MRSGYSRDAFFLSIAVNSARLEMAIKFKDFMRSPASTDPHFLVVGHPISHSLSPIMHQCALDYHQIPARYLAVDLSPDDITTFLSWCNRDTFCGANVTIPYKETFYDAVDDTDSVSSNMGVINTICKEDGLIKGYNTDLYGFMKPLEDYLDQMEDGSAIVFGSGGASKAVITGLIQCGISDITVISRTPEVKKNRLSDSGITVRMAGYSNWSAFAEDAVVIVNSTPLGMSPDINSCPVPAHEGFHLKDKICYDLVYNPLQTRFLNLSEEHGGIALNGIEMLIWQGSRSFELWTGKTFPYDKVKQVLLDYFKR